MGDAEAMKEIKLTQGKVALVDDDMFDFLNQWRWHYVKPKDSRTGYAARTVGPKYHTKMIYMHTLIMHTPSGMEVDHNDHNGCNNQRYNLRNCTSSQNKMNGILPRTNTSGYKGVSWDKRYHTWYAHIKINGKNIFLGNFDNPRDAARAYNEKAIELFGEFAQLNDV